MPTNKRLLACGKTNMRKNLSTGKSSLCENSDSGQYVAFSHTAKYNVYIHHMGGINEAHSNLYG
jgi:hypothetical protein